jgi:hypothetical protein
MSLISSTIIEDIKSLCEASQASFAYFYFDFRNANKQGLRDLLPSLLTQLSARSAARCNILSKLYSDHDSGKMQPSDSVLAECLKDMLTLPDQRPIYLIMDALDESPITSGIPSARERVLQLLKELVDLGLPNLHICVTSRPEIDIRNAVEPLTSLRVSLHDQTGQKEDIAEYVRSIVYSDSDTNMKRWKMEDKELVVKTLAERAEGMYVNYFMLVMHVSNCQTGSAGCFASWKSYGTVFRRAFGIFLTNYRNHWTRHTSVYSGRSRSRTEIMLDVCCSASLWPSDRSRWRSLPMSSLLTSTMRRRSQS